MNQTKEYVTAYLLFVLIAVSCGVLAMQFPVGYIWLTYEDLFGEWSQFYLFTIALILSARLAFNHSRYAPCFALLTIACLYVCGEEISWGQRLFNLATPDFFQQHNLQQELNLHNFITGPYSTVLKRTIEVLLVCSLLGFGLVYPHPASDRLPLIGRLKKWLPPPPRYLWPFLSCAAVLELRLFRFNEAEIAEILIALAVAIYALYYWHLHQQLASPRRALRPMSSGMVMILLSALCLATTTTTLLLSLPDARTSIETRIERGMGKFAERYGRYGQWQHSQQLYAQLLERNPGSAFLQQRLAASQQKLGYTQEAEQTLIKVIQQQMRRYSKQPLSVSLNLSLATSFELIGNQERCTFHLQQALDNAQRKVRLEPNSAHAAYWLGRSYQRTQQPQKALAQYQRACELEPSHLRYKKAWYQARQKQAES